MRAIPRNRIVATLGPYKYYFAIPLTHLYKFKAVDCCACVKVLERLMERELEVLYLVAAL